MEDIAVLLAVWAVLCAVLAGYVIWRFATDRSDGSHTHRWFPLVSKTTDPTFPLKSAWLQWAAYIVALAFLSFFLVQVAKINGLL
jgi:hypothetical protein